MKTVIFAGGLGTRLSEETAVIPKPMVEIGGYPILWHIMKIYSAYGINDFIVLTGYKSHVIKKYFVDYYTRYSDLTVDLEKNSLQLHNIRSEPWRVTILYTGEKNMTGSRLAQARKYIGNETFMLTYGDGVADVNIDELLVTHKKSKCIATVTAVQPKGRFGTLLFNQTKGQEERIVNFAEKISGDGHWINGGFFVCEPEIFNYLSCDCNCVFEQGSMQQLVERKELTAYKHNGFWHCMDTLSDKNELNRIWNSQKAPWKVWND